MEKMAKFAYDKTDSASWCPSPPDLLTLRMQAHDWNDLLLEIPMKHKIVYTVGACLAAVLAAVLAAALTRTVLPRASAAPGAAPPRPRMVAAANAPQVFTLRYVAFVAKPKTKDDAALYKGFPPVLAQGLHGDGRYALTTTPEGFLKVLQADQPDHDFNMYLAGSAVLYNSRAASTQIADGPNPTDPYGMTLSDKITINQNSDTALDFVSQGKFSFRPPGGEGLGGTTGWNGENKELMIGRTYMWGATRKDDGTCITWAFCILPGSLDQVASTWKRHDGARTTVLASGKTLRGRTGQ